MTENKIFDFIKNTINTNDIVVFMKGSKDFPECGFSSYVTGIFKKLNVPFQDMNVLTSNEMRQAIKDFSNWPTIPQVYIKGEFIGGCDILKELYETGELQIILQNHKIL